MGGMVAIKKMTNVFGHPLETKRTLRELRLLRHFIEHENVLTIRNVLLPRNGGDLMEDIFVVTELMDTDLDQVIRSQQPLSMLHIQTFLYQILRGLQFIHAANVIHRDLKPGNILVNQNCTVKICDFGLARLEPETGYGGFMTEYVVTRWYRAPEIMLSGQDYTQSIDVWSVGCILAEMLGRQPLFPGKNYVDQVRVIVDILGNPSEAGLMMIEDAEARAYVKSLPSKPGADWAKRYPEAGGHAADLLDKLLRFDPNERCSVDEALMHPYLAPIRAEDRDVFEPAAPFTFDFENADLSEEACRQLVMEEINYYKQEDLRLSQDLSRQLAQQEMFEEEEEEMGAYAEEEEIPFGRDSLTFAQGDLNQAEGMAQRSDAQYNTMVMNMQKVMMGEVVETSWGTKLLTPVSEEREEDLSRARREDEALAASDKAASRVRDRHRATAAAAAVAQARELAVESDDSDHPPTRRRVRDYAEPPARRLSASSSRENSSNGS